MVVSDELAQRVQARLGTTIADKWRLSRVLGIGGMAAVYAAVHRNQNRVAIKMLHAEQSLNETVRTRFLREGYVANTVEHPGAVRIFDDGVADGGAFLVMELLEGESLEDRRDRLGGRLPTADVLSLCDQLLDTLAAAHAKGIVHRDIKPDNLFLTTTGKLKVLDFGIARLRELSEAGGTAAGTFMGTPSFMSPEQARGRWGEVDARSDLWAVGATMFYLLTGRLVHDADSFVDQLTLAVREPAPSLASIDPGIPSVASEIVDRALAYGSLERFQDARSMQEAVRGALRVLSTSQTQSAYAGSESLQWEAEPRLELRRRSGETQTLLATPDPLSPSPGRHTSVAPVAILPTGGRSASSVRRVVVGLSALAVVLLLVFIARWVQRPDEIPTMASEALHPPGLPADAKPQAATPVSPQPPSPSAAGLAAAPNHLTVEAAKGVSAEPTLSPRPKPVPARAREHSSTRLKAKEPETKTASETPPAHSTSPATSARSPNLFDKRF
jgi:serine/threonine-protein kinase